MESSSGRGRTTDERNSSSKDSISTGVFCWIPDHLVSSSVALLEVGSMALQ